MFLMYQPTRQALCQKPPCQLGCQIYPTRDNGTAALEDDDDEDNKTDDDENDKLIATTMNMTMIMKVYLHMHLNIWEPLEGSETHLL